MIKSMRGRLQCWYGAVYAVSIIFLGTLVYWRTERDMHDRAILQAVSTAQYLEVSLREASNGPGELPPHPLPPEFPVRPGPRNGPPSGRDPAVPPRDVAAADRGDAGRPRGPDGRDRPEAGGAGGPRPPLDRMEFAVLKRDGSVLNQSHNFPLDRLRLIPITGISAPAPQVQMVNEGVEARMRVPQGITVIVYRPMREDRAGLRRFATQIAITAVVTLAAGLYGGWWISGRIVRPITTIAETAARISASSLSQRVETGKLDSELVPLASVLNETFSRLQQSFEKLTQFTADASHELRTPLAVIQSHMELALSQPRTEQSYQQTLEVCLKSSDRMRSLIEGLLLLARADSNRLDLCTGAVDLCRIAEESVTLLASKADSAGVELECVTTEDVAEVRGDSRFLAQVAANLVENAIQYTPAGGKISVEVRRESEDIVFTVKDTGCGIPAEHIPFLFERFYRADTARSRRHGGSGLGLSICRSLVEAHRGTISCESKIGEGSVFIVRLPSA